MPFKDADVARTYQREGARRRRAAKAAQRAAVVEAETTPPVATTAPRVARIAVEVAPDVTPTDLLTAGRILGHMQGHGEPDTAYRDRLRAVWRALLRVVE